MDWAAGEGGDVLSCQSQSRLGGRDRASEPSGSQAGA